MRIDNFGCLSEGILIFLNNLMLRIIRNINEILGSCQTVQESLDEDHPTCNDVWYWRKHFWYHIVVPLLVKENITLVRALFSVNSCVCYGNCKIQKNEAVLSSTVFIQMSAIEIKSQITIFFQIQFTTCFHAPLEILKK